MKFAILILALALAGCASKHPVTAARAPTVAKVTLPPNVMPLCFNAALNPSTEVRPFLCSGSTWYFEGESTSWVLQSKGDEDHYLIAVVHPEGRVATEAEREDAMAKATPFCHNMLSSVVVLRARTDRSGTVPALVFRCKPDPTMK